MHLVVGWSMVLNILDFGGKPVVVATAPGEALKSPAPLLG